MCRCQDYETQPRFPGPDGRARPVEDKSEMCGRWKENGGCALNSEGFNSIEYYYFNSSFPFFEETSPNRGFFNFMQMSCLATCGWADMRGCVDEHPRCEEWTRKGHCTTSPYFMAHTCRESCGVCGFLSPFNTEDQEVNGASYSEHEDDNFKCGEFNLLCEINGEDCEGKMYRVTQEEEEEEWDLREKREVDLGSRRHRRAAGGFSLIRNSAFTGLSVVPSSDSYSYIGGATIVSDRSIQNTPSGYLENNFCIKGFWLVLLIVLTILRLDSTLILEKP